VTGRAGLLLAAEHGSADLCRALPTGDRPGEDRVRLLVLLTYCYLSGVYRSQDVVLQVEADLQLRRWMPWVGYRPEEVRRFRREHRGLLTACLARTLNLLTPAPFGSLRQTTLLPRLTNLGRLDCIGEARERVDRAVVLDTLALDV